MDDSYIYAIVALLPLAAVMLTVQVNPYNALVIRGILGAPPWFMVFWERQM